MLRVMPGPLEGIRVIDFGRFIAGPYCAMLLADFGADVIRVERREGGEDRKLGPVTESGEGGLFLNCNRNKRGITLDLGHPGAADIVRKLVRTADILVVNLPLAVMKKLHLDYDSVREEKKDIILVMASAFGPDGPYTDRLGFDGVAQAMSGAASLTGFPGPPVRSLVSWADYGTALHGAFGAMTALYHRQKTGQGQLIDVSLLATGVTFMTPLLAELKTRGIQRKQLGNTAYYAAPSDVYKTQDGWIIVPTVGGPMFKRWARLIGRKEMIEDPRFRDDISRGNNAVVINEAMSEWCAGRTREQAIAELEGARVPCGPCYDLDEVLADPQVASRKLLQEIEYPGGTQPVPIASSPVRLGDAPVASHRRAPTLGEHTGELLKELGFSPDDITAFRASKVI
jgi:crotonobetainyl-CoA:carnitine CoA-transferase CaiB-like acyl-CoA transferase